MKTRGRSGTFYAALPTPREPWGATGREDPEDSPVKQSNAGRESDPVGSTKSFTLDDKMMANIRRRSALRGNDPLLLK